VPAFLLQPIVENAFRHGIGNKAGRCRLEVGASMAAGRLRVTIRDDGAGVPAGFDLERDAGTGLSNIRTRLRNLYGGPASLSVGAAPGGGTLVVLELPPEPPAELARASA
jgi:LytS/YehU family sensor histidine kinase